MAKEMIKFSQMKFEQLDLKEIELKFNKIINEFENAKSFEQQDKVLMKLNKFSDYLNTNFNIAYAKYTCNTEDEENIKNQEIVDEIEPLISVFFDKFNKALLNAKYRKQLEEKWGSHLFNMIQTSVEIFDEKIVPELQEINKLSSEYTKLISSAKINYKG